MAIESDVSSNADREVVDSEQLPLKNENPIAAFDASLLLSLVIEATAFSPNPTIYAFTLYYFPVLANILATIHIAKPSCAVDTSAIDARVEVVSRCLITIYSDYSRKSGKDDSIVENLLGLIIRDMGELKTRFADGPATSQLLCFLVFRCAKIFVKLGHKREAWLACCIALQIIADCSDMQNLELAIKLLKIRIRGFNEEPDWEKLNQEFFRTEDHSTSSLLLTGFIRESGHSNNPKLDLKMIEESLTGALKLEEEMCQYPDKVDRNDPAKQATIRLTLAIYHVRRKESSSSQKTCLTLLKQAMAGFRQVECRCGPHFMKTDYYDELFGATECPRHQLLADALLYQGIVQSQLGLCNEARTSFEEGLSLVECHCKYEEDRKFFLCYNLSMLNPVEFPHHVRSYGTESSKSALNYQEEFKPLPRQHLPDDVGECSTSSEARVELCGEASKGPPEIVDGFTTRRLLLLFLMAAIDPISPHPLELHSAIREFPELSDILGTRTSAKSCCVRHGSIEVATRCFIKIICGKAKKSGKDENIEMYIRQVVGDLKELHKDFPSRSNSELQVFLIFRCAKILLQLGRNKELVLQVCESGKQIIGSRSDMDVLLLGILIVEAVIHGVGTKDIHWKSIIKFEPLIKDALSDRDDLHCASALVISLLTGYLREVKQLDPILDLKMAKDVLNKALIHEGKTNNDAAKQATIRLTLAFYYLKEQSTDSHQVCLTLLKQAIAGFREVECRCPQYHMRTDFYEDLFGATECPRHVLLADALSYQGIIQSEDGLMDEAEKSFKEGLSLVNHCNDEKRVLSFNIRLSELQQSMNPTNLIYGTLGMMLARLNAPGYDPSHDLIGTAEAQYVRKVMKDMGILDNNILHRIMKETDGSVIEQLKGLLSSKAQVQEYVQRSGPSGDFLGLAAAHGTLCFLSTLCEGYETAGKEHLSLAMQALDLFWESSKSSMSNWRRRHDYLEQLMILGHYAMLPQIMELDHAHKLWHKAYQLTQKKIEDLVQNSSEDHVLHYYETSKHVCVALASCESLRAFHLQGIPGQNNELRSANSRSLLWAERGKGMLTMLFKTGRSRLVFELDPTSSNMLDVETLFMGVDEFALGFLHSPSELRNSLQPKKTVFVEYTFLNQMILLINVMLDGGGNLSFRLDLSKVIDEETQLEAEKELEKAENELKAHKSSSSPNSEVGSQSFTKPMTESNIPERPGIGPGGGGAPNKVLMALYKSGVNRAPFNRSIPGMVAGIQRRAEIAQKKRVIQKDFAKEEEEIQRLLQKLYAVLIKPIEGVLRALFRDPNPKGDNTLVFVPHEDLGVVPFAALHEKEKSPYLIQQYAISVSPAIWCSRRLECTYAVEVLEKRPGLQEARPPVLVGRKDGYPDRFGPLKEAHKEVAAVAQALKPTACMEMIDDDSDPDIRTCMKERVLDVLPEASWIHLSVHGEISSQFPQGSLVLGDNDNQRLSAAEIIDSGLHSSTWRAPCVVASACQSGLGSVAGGGIMGFARAFMLAGVNSCVLSMWEVNQTFCTSFMGKLYTELGSGKDIGDAIQITTTSMMDDWQERKIPARTYRFKKREPSKPVTSERVPKWSILDWAAFACFGFPGVKLPDFMIATPDTTSAEPSFREVS